MYLCCIMEHIEWQSYAVKKNDEDVELSCISRGPSSLMFQITGLRNVETVKESAKA